MKKKLHLISEILKAGLDVVFGVLCFLRIDHDVAVLPIGSGETERVDYYYSIYEKLLGANLQVLVYLALALMAVSLTLSVLSCIAKDNRKVTIASHVLFFVSALFFLFLLIYATRVLQYAY